MLELEKILKSKQLPSLPSVAVKLLELAKNSEADVREFVELVRTDPALSLKILKAANSSFFGLSHKVTSLERAVPLLGTTVVTSLGLSFSLAESAMAPGPLRNYYSDYWRHSVVQGVAAETLCEYIPNSLCCEYFLAGLLMDIGRLALLKTFPKESVEAITSASELQESLYVREQEIWGMHHGDIGARLMEQWSLPERLVESCRAHHASIPELQTFEGSADYWLISAVALSATVGDYFCTTAKGQALQRMQTMAERIFGFDEAALDALLQKIMARMNSAAELFSVDIDELGDPSDIMAEANQQLAQLAMREHATNAQLAAQKQKSEEERLQLQSQNELLAKKALHDPLTGVHNRDYFNESLKREVHRCCRHAVNLGVVFMDIDNFKKLNDSYGHQFGDEVLVRVAKILKENIRSSDILARYGGEEFVILANQPTEKGLMKLLERLRSSIEKERIEFNGQWVPVTASIGGALILPAREDMAVGDKLIAAADAAMYECKRAGRNRVKLESLLNTDERRVLQGVTQNRFSRWLVNRGVADIATVSKALSHSKPKRVRIGELAVNQGYLQADDLERVLALIEQNGRRFGETAQALGLLTEQQLIMLLVLQQECPSDLAQKITDMRLLPSQNIGELLQIYLQEMGIRELQPG